MNRLKVVAWFITITLHVLLMSYSNASNQNKSDVDSELSRIVKLPAAPVEDLGKLFGSEKTRVHQSFGEVTVAKIEKLDNEAGEAAQRGDWKKSINLSQQIIAIDPQYWHALYSLAINYTFNGNPDKGLEYAAKALQRIRFVDIYFTVASAYAKKDDKDKALLWLKKAYESGYAFNKKPLEEIFVKYLDDPKFKTITARNYELLKRCKPFSDFSTKYAAATLVNPEALAANPFVYEGKTVKLYLYFAQMETATTAIFSFNNGGSSIPVALFDDVPRGLYTQEVRALVVGRVKGKTTKKLSGFDFPLVHLKYIEALKEPPSGCPG